MNSYISVRNELFQNIDGELVWKAAFKDEEDCRAVAQSLNSKITIQAKEMVCV